ncbi:uncharacterized protein MICPUCDRAFT_6771, partial [Micromonas pusilla CCMP1545]
ELALMDAQQRTLLHVTADALRTSSASVDHGGLLGKKRTSVSGGGFPVGVYVAISSMDHQKLLERRRAPISPFTATGGALSVAAGRVAFIHGLIGAAVAIDTACSSSLVAIQVAATNSRVSQHAALVAGINLIQVPETTVMFIRAGMIAPDGRCKTLDVSANGYSRGEGVGALGLVDSITATAIERVIIAATAIVGTCVNQDGRSSSLTVPNGPSQQAVVRGALNATAESSTRKNGIVNAIHLHGTGT